MKKCESCLAGFSKEDVRGNCTCDDMTNPDIEKKIWTQVNEWSKRMQGMPMSPEDEIKWRKSWFLALQEMYEMGRSRGMAEESIKCLKHCEEAAADMKKRILKIMQKLGYTGNAAEFNEILDVIQSP